MAGRTTRLGVFREILEACRCEEKPEAVLLVAQDHQLVRLLLAWEKTVVRRKRRLSELPPNAGDSIAWDWLWENVTYAPEELAAVSGLSAERVAQLLAVLRGNRLIYPDGTLNRFAAQYLRAKVWGLFRTRSAKSPPPKKGVVKSTDS